MSPGQDETHACGYIYIYTYYKSEVCISIYKRMKETEILQRQIYYIIMLTVLF